MQLSLAVEALLLIRLRRLDEAAELDGEELAVLDEPGRLDRAQSALMRPDFMPAEADPKR